MDRSSKLGSVLVLLGFIAGVALIIFGIFPATEIVVTPAPAPSVIAIPEATSSAIRGVDGQMALVVKVIDGDTLEVDIDGENFKLRLVGIDTPETVDPRRPVGCFGKEASSQVKELLSGKKVILQKDVSNTDKFGRLLRLVYLPLEDKTTLFVNDYLVREGFAKASTYPPDVKYAAQFLAAQKQAQENNRGLWGSCK